MSRDYAVSSWVMFWSYPVLLTHTSEMEFSPRFTMNMDLLWTGPEKNSLGNSLNSFCVVLNKYSDQLTLGYEARHIRFHF